VRRRAAARVIDADAHCDIPCGVYETGTAATAARTVVALTRKLLELEGPDAKAASSALLEYLNTSARMIAVKDQHAQLCKEQILILWTDYFKPNHLKLFPDLHETVWHAAKLCSFVKQHVNLAKAEELEGAVRKIAGLFDKAEAAKK